jgi:hypothetical protein
MVLGRKHDWYTARISIYGAFLRRGWLGRALNQHRRGRMIVRER